MSALRFGADVNAENHAGRTPLHYAAGCNPNLPTPAARETVARLLALGADVYARDGNGGAVQVESS